MRDLSTHAGMISVARRLLILCLVFTSFLAAAGSDKKEGLSRRSFIKATALAAAAASQPVRAAQLLQSVSVGAMSAASGSVIDPLVAIRKAALVAERTAQAFPTKGLVFEVVHHEFPIDIKQAVELPRVKLPVGISTEWFSSQLAKLEVELGKTFNFGLNQVSERGEQLRGVRGLYEVTLTTRGARLLGGAPSLPPRRFNLGKAFDRAYLAGLRNIDEAYAAQAEHRWDKMRELGEQVFPDRREWRRQYWYHQFISDVYFQTDWLKSYRRDHQQGGVSREDLIDFLFPQPDGLPERETEFLAHARALAARFEELEEHLAQQHGLDIEAVYESSTFLYEGEPLIWQAGFHARVYPRPSPAFETSYVKGIHEISAMLAERMRRRRDDLETDILKRYEMTFSISPEALAILEDEVSARYPEAFEAALQTFDRTKPWESMVNPSTREEQLQRVCTQILATKFDFKMDIYRRASEQIAQLRAREGAKVETVYKISGGGGTPSAMGRNGASTPLQSVAIDLPYHARASVEPAEQVERAERSRLTSVLDHVARPLFESCVDATLKGDSKETTTTDSPPADLENESSDAPESPRAVPAPLPELPAPQRSSVLDGIERVRRQQELVRESKDGFQKPTKRED